MTRVSARGKVTKLPTRGRAPVSPAPKATTSSSQSRPRSLSQQSAKSRPASQKAESSTTNDGNNKLKKAVRDLLSGLQYVQKVVWAAHEWYTNEDYKNEELEKAKTRLRVHQQQLDEHKKILSDKLTERITDVLTSKTAEKIDIHALLTNYSETERMESIKYEKEMFFAAAELEKVTIRNIAYQDLLKLINNMISSTHWLISLLEGSVQSPKEAFSAQTY